METLQNILSQQIIQRLGWTLVHFIWQGALVALFLAVILRFLKKSSSNLRYTAACTAMVVMVVLPVITIRVVDISVPAVNMALVNSHQVQMIETTSKIKADLPAVESNPQQIIALPAIPLKERFVNAVEPILPYAVLSWLAGVLLLSVWYLGGWTQLQRLRKQMVKPVSSCVIARLEQLSQRLGISKAINIFQSALVSVPTVIGHLKPVILLPATALTGLSGEQLEAILAHELAHIKRCDYLVNIGQTVVEILGFYHPAVWWISGKIRAERENCCDDIAVKITGDNINYASALAAMEEIRSSATEDTEFTEKNKLAVAASGGNLFDRICRLLGKTDRNNEKVGWLPSVIAFLLVMFLIISTGFALSSKERGQNQKISEPNRVENPLVFPDEVKQAAEKLFNDIKNADYDGLMNSGKKAWWSDFPVWDNYMTEKWQDKLVIWMCQTFRENPIVQIELGEVFTSDVQDMKLNNLPAMPYKLILKDGGVLEGNLPFRYVVDKNNKAGGYWQGIHGIDWHLQENPIKKANENTGGQTEDFKQRLEEPVTVHIDKSPDSNRLTIQYAVIAICEAAGVPYQWDKSTELTNTECRRYIAPVNIEDKVASQAIADLIGPVGLLYGVDANGVYLYNPEKTTDIQGNQSNFEILDVNFEPIRQGRNILWLTVKNTTDKDLFLKVHIYTRSVNYGPQGVGWGTGYYEKIDAGQIRNLRYVYKIQGPITKNTYVRLSLSNAKSLIHDENREIKPFVEKQYSTEDLKIYSADNVQFAAALSEQLKAVSQALAEIQGYIRSGDYEKAWNLFSSDYQKAEYQGKGVESFKLQMEPKHPLNSAFLWGKQDFLKLKPVSAYINEGKVVLTASVDTTEWKIDFIQQDGQWKIDWIIGYRPKILDMQ